MITLIAAVARNRAIGLHNRLLYHLPNDMRRFRRLTTGHTIIMGRRTFESFPKGALPDRRNVVLSRSGATYEGAETYASLEAALQTCRADEDVYIIGGESVYRQALPLAQRLCLTLIDDTPDEADAFFPEYTGWTETSREAHHKDERHAYDYTFADYTR